MLGPDRVDLPVGSFGPDWGATTAPQSGRYGSDVLAELLRDLDIEYVAFVPGATTRGLHDSIVNHLGNRKPQLILCTDENVAVNVARGYYLATGKKMAVMLHDVVGLLNAAAGIYDAWVDLIPMLIIGGSGPSDAHIRRPWLDWVHSSDGQGQVVRNLVKLDEQPSSLEAAIESLQRCSDLADSPPYGPTYVAIDVALQEVETDLRHDDVIQPGRHRPVKLGAADSVRIAEVAEKLVGAEKPLIITDLAGRSKEGFNSLRELAELLSIPVLDKGTHGQNFPSPHALSFTGPDAPALVEDADLILGVDVVDLGGEITRPRGFGHSGPPRRPRPAQTIVEVTNTVARTGSLAPLHFSLTPVDFSLVGDSPSTVSSLVAEVRSVLDARGDAAVHERQMSRAKILETQASSAPVPRSSVDGVLTAHGLFATLAEVFDKDSMILAGDHPAGWYAPGWFEITGARQNIAALGAGSVGCATGTVLGAALAHASTGKCVIGVVGDGDLLMAQSALWTAAHFDLRTILIVENNRSYYSDEVHQKTMASARGRPDGNHGIGIHIDNPTVNFAGLAQSFGVEGIGPVADSDSFKGALVDSFRLVEAGKSVVIDVHTGARR